MSTEVADTTRKVLFAVTTLYSAGALALQLLGHAQASSGAASTDAQRWLLRALMATPSLAGYALLIFDKWAWRSCLIHWMVGRPRLDGTWLGTVTPNKASRIPAGGATGPIPAALVIHQTYWTLGVSLITRHSRSESRSALLRSQPDAPERRELFYVYQNHTNASEQPRSMDHLGASRLFVVGRTPMKLHGVYWTGRLTMGGMVFAFVDRRQDYADLEEVEAASARSRLTAEQKADEAPLGDPGEPPA